MNCGVYKITCTESWKSYIGSSKEIDKRWQTHRTRLKCNTHENRHLQNAYNKYGADAFIYEVAMYCTDEKDLLNLEDIWFEIIPKEFRYNINHNAFKPPSALGRIMTPELRKKIGDPQRGKIIPLEIRAKTSKTRIERFKTGLLRVWNDGIKTGPQSVELIARRSEAMTGVPKGSEHKRKLKKSALNLLANGIHNFQNLTETQKQQKSESMKLAWELRTGKKSLNTEQNICETKYGTFRVIIKVNGVKFDKSFMTLLDAINYRNEVRI